MTAQLFDLEATHNPHRWYLPVTEDLCVGRQPRRFLFGGVALAAAISALEQTCRRPVIWATAQYLSFARPGSIVDLDVWVPVEGNQTSQAFVVEHIDDSKIITVNAALGARESAIADQWLCMPSVPRPAECPPINWYRPQQGLQERFDTSVAEGRAAGDPIDGRGADGRLRLWVRSNEGLRTDRLLLAVIADYVSVGIANAIGQPAGGNSLDNTIRFARVVPGEWVLCDIQIETVSSGVVHGTMHLFSEDGVLMASASQSLILRHFDSPAGDRQSA